MDAHRATAPDQDAGFPAHRLRPAGGGRIRQRNMQLMGRFPLQRYVEKVYRLKRRRMAASHVAETS